MGSSANCHLDCYQYPGAQVRSQTSSPSFHFVALPGSLGTTFRRRGRRTPNAGFCPTPCHPSRYERTVASASRKPGRMWVFLCDRDPMRAWEVAVAKLTSNCWRCSPSRLCHNLRNKSLPVMASSRTRFLGGPDRKLLRQSDITSPLSPVFPNTSRIRFWEAQPAKHVNEPVATRRMGEIYQVSCGGQARESRNKALNRTRSCPETNHEAQCNGYLGPMDLAPITTSDTSFFFFFFSVRVR